MDDEALLTDLYNAFDPFEPLPADSPQYVDCRDVRGNADIWQDLGKKLLRSDRSICQLYAGHRGGGKSTELMQLRAKLEERGFYVVYFAADEDDIDPEDTQYTDILLACTRHLLRELRDSSDAEPITTWLSDRWNDLKDLALMEIKLEDLKVNIEQQITLFGKLSASVRAVPSQRQKIRERLDPHTVTLLAALNQFIQGALEKLPGGKKHLVVMADNLDRIVPVPRSDHRTNHDEIFLDRAGQLQGLDCHVIYTIPISLAYSSRASDLRDMYGDVTILPMVMVRTRAGDAYLPGREKLKDMLQKRIEQHAHDRKLVPDIFEELAMERLLEMSGGHMRNLMLLVQSSIDYLDTLPITATAMEQSIAKAREQMRLTPEESEWELLREVASSRRVPNDDKYRRLLFNRCILQYYDSEAWYDVHPLLKDTPEFGGTNNGSA